MGLFDSTRLHGILRATIASGLVDERDKLIADIDPLLAESLPTSEASAEQLLSDLLILNRTGRIDAEIPFRSWLQSAARLSGDSARGDVFRGALAQLDQRLAGDPDPVLAGPLTPAELGILAPPLRLLNAGNFALQGGVSRLVRAGERLYASESEGVLGIFDPFDVGAEIPCKRLASAFAAGNGGVSRFAVSGAFVYVAAGGGGGLRVFDSKLPGDLPGSAILAHEGAVIHPISIAVAGTLAYLGTENGKVLVVDIASPRSPKILKTLVLAEGKVIQELTVTGHLLLAGAADLGLHVLDITAPTMPVLLSRVAMSTLRGLTADGDLVFVADGYNGLQIVDIADPSHPEVLPTGNFKGDVYDVAVSGPYAYVSDKDQGILVYDIARPRGPVLVQILPLSGEPNGLALVETRLFIGNENGLPVVEHDAAPAPKITEHLGDAQIREIITVIGNAGLPQDLLLEDLLLGLPDSVRGKMRKGGSPLRRLAAHLVLLNRAPRLDDGTLPLEIWLRNAARYPRLADVANRALARMNRGPAGIALPPDFREGRPWQQERIVLSTDDLLPIDFLQGGADASRSVARITVKRFDKGDDSASETYVGTAWLIAPDLIITNHHVVNARSDYTLATEDELELQVASIQVQFDYDPDREASSTLKVVKLECFAPFDGPLDYAILRLETPIKLTPLPLYLGAFPRTADAHPCVNIIQHPGGSRKMVACRNNQVIRSDDSQLWYFTDTMNGSSGSPVFDDHWRVVALHKKYDYVDKGLAYQGKEA
ncbi:MAG: trypsin-like peptidase domain-containing protein, partial [Minicystis sp.]